MLPTCFPIQKDELFSGWLNEIATAIGLPFGTFAHYYLGNIGSMRHYKYFGNLDNIVQKYSESNLYFPDLYEIIKEHTDFVVARICMGDGWAAKTTDNILREQKKGLQRRNFDSYNECSMCREEDIQKYGRSIIHVSHQISGVRVCYKHGISFGEEIKDLLIERKIAAFAKELLDIKPDCTFCDYKNQITIEMIENSIEDGYLNKEEGTRLKKFVNNHNNRFEPSIIRFLAWRYCGNAKLFSESIVYRDIEHINNDLFTMKRCEFGIGEFLCKKCGHTFHMSKRSVDVGEVCPNCLSGMTTNERLERILKFYKDGNYIIQDNRLVHTICGYKAKITALFWLDEGKNCYYCHGEGIKEWEKAFRNTEFNVIGMIGKNSTLKEGWSKSLVHRWVCLKHIKCGYEFEVGATTKHKNESYKILCPKCSRKSLERKKHRACKTYNPYLGERRVGVNGIGCEIVGGYINKNDPQPLIVRFDNGLERKMSLKTFRHLGDGCRDRLPEQYIGLSKAMYDGRIGKIVKYEDTTRILVEFEDGTTTWSNMKKFKKGKA